METESRGVKFYSEASELVTRGTTRNAFLAMLEDERSHFARLEAEWNILLSEQPGLLDAPVFLHFDFAALKKIFPSRDQIDRRLKAEVTEAEALKLAMQMEQDAQRFFSNYAEKFNDTKGRDIFLKFAEEEQEHIDIIQAAYDDLLTGKTEKNQ
ncbi:MAG: ferritin-like domain-containing protein [bacterium]